ncbi:tetratricopeptide repeat protein [Sandarakinorhabdus sp.]|uniref:tetratricopeptide repeat protein n=1 Tax=Sandarakinorhabdus sp. TaxID=1916663 RepID=UPI003F6F37F1
MNPASRPAAGIALALAMASPAAAARSLPDDMKARATGMPASALAAGQDSEGALDQGRALLAASNPAQAISAFRIALAQAPQSVAALNGIAVAYDRLGRADLARQHFEMALALEPDAADIAYNLGLALVRGGQDRAAIPHLQRAAAGNDPRAAAAARRMLALIAARLTAPEAPAAMAAAPAPAPSTAGPRIDIASSGEAVLVLAPSPAKSQDAAQDAGPVRMAAAAVAPPPDQPGAAAPAAAMALALVERLGDAAALTIPQTVSMNSVPSREEAPMPAPALIHIGPQQPQQQPLPAAPRRTALAVPALPPKPTLPEPAQPANRPVPAMAAAPRPSAPAALLVRWRRADVEQGILASNQTVSNRAVSSRETPLPPPAPDDDKAAIRLAIARLEALVSRIEVQRG